MTSAAAAVAQLAANSGKVHGDQNSNQVKFRVAISVFAVIKVFLYEQWPLLFFFI